MSCRLFISSSSEEFLWLLPQVTLARFKIFCVALMESDVGKLQGFLTEFYNLSCLCLIYCILKKEVEPNCHLVLVSMLLSQDFFCRRDAGVGAHWGCCESLFCLSWDLSSLLCFTGGLFCGRSPKLRTDFIKMLNFSNFCVG